jgi:hypothetical protein
MAAVAVAIREPGQICGSFTEDNIVAHRGVPGSVVGAFGRTRMTALIPQAAGLRQNRSNSPKVTAKSFRAGR